MACEKQAHRKSKVSEARLIRFGLVGPKAYVKTKADGQLVDIPVPHLIVRLTDGVTQEDSQSELRFVEAGSPLKLWRKAIAEGER